MGLSSSTTKTNTTAAPNPQYAPYIKGAADTLQPAYEAAQANNANLLTGVNSALGYEGDVLSGKYLNGNPYLDSVIAKTNADIKGGVDSSFEGAGRYGSGMYATALAKAIGDNENTLRYGNYATERQYQSAAPGQIAALTGISAGLPQAASSTYADAVRALLGQYTNTTGTQTSTPSILQTIAMLGSAAAESYGAVKA